jgi:putative membrane protein
MQFHLGFAQVSGPRARHGSIGGMVSFLLRAALTGFALWIVTLVVPGMSFVGGDTTLQKIGIILVVAVIFGLVNAIIKPIVQIISIPLYILTLGLIHIVINALMLWLTSWITEHTTHWGLFIDDFWWTAIWAAIVLSIVSWALSLIVRDTQRVTRT